MTEIDLTPRPPSEPVRRRRRLGPSVVLAGVLVAGGFVIWQFLSQSTLFFCNADQVGVTKECSPPKRFRLQGTVVADSVQKGSPLRFDVEFANKIIPVTYQGDPGGVFCEGVPVVVEGRYANGVFDGDRILVKHTEQYKAEQPGRVRDCGI